MLTLQCPFCRVAYMTASARQEEKCPTCGSLFPLSPPRTQAIPVASIAPSPRKRRPWYDSRNPIGLTLIIITIVAVAIWVIVGLSGNSPSDAERRRLQEEKRELVDDVMIALQPVPGQDAGTVLLGCRIAKQRLQRLREIAERLGEPTTKIDEMEGKIGRLESIARRGLGSQ